MMKNILFSTTRQWNPGDEFILFGIRRLFEALGLRYNPVIFNRNPEINPPLTDWNPLRRVVRTLKGEQYWKSFVRIGSADNSFKPGMDAGFIDLAVFAGTPSWSSRENLPMYRAIREARLPTCYLGIGGFPTLADPGFRFRADIDQTLRNALLITVRDRKAHELLKGYGAHHLPCPALLSSPREKTIDGVHTIGLIYSAWRTHKSHSVPREAHRRLVELYDTIRDAYDGRMRIVFIAHYIDELPEIYEQFGPDADVRYAYDAREYIDIYGECDLVVGARVHGIGMAASLGVPGVHLGHDGRAGTVEGFLAANFDTQHWGETARIREVLDEAIANAPERNLALRRHKQETFERYRSLLQMRLAGMLERPRPEEPSALPEPACQPG